MIGRISVAVPPASGLTFPFVTDYPYGMDRSWSVVTHRFGSRATLSTQRFLAGIGQRRFHFQKATMSRTERRQLLDFYDAIQGSYQTFTYNAPDRVASTDPLHPFAYTEITTPYSVIWDQAPLSIRDLATMCATGFSFIEAADPASAPTYTVTSIVTRFPSSGLATALLSQVQELIPLVDIQVRDSSVPGVYFSDRRCTLSGTGLTTHTYLPRVLEIGDPGGDVLMSQSISGQADSVRLVFGNADRAISQLCNDTSLKYADIDICLFHVQSQTLIQLWKGVILDWQVSGGPTVPVTCSDGLYPITQQYPRRTISRQCWKTFNDGVNCPWSSTPGHTGNPSSCDFFFNSANGCLSHGMDRYFGGHPAFPQTVVIKDIGASSFFNQQFVASTSIISDSIWGSPLSEIWANDHGSPLNAFMANAVVAAVRDESTWEDVLGIIGVGPIGAYEGMSVQTTTDGYKFIVSPMADGFPPQGFQVDSQLVITGYRPDMGLREVPGNDPVLAATSLTNGADQFSLGHGTPQQWDVYDPTFSNIPGISNWIFPYAAGTAFVELRYAKDAGSGLAPTTAESHTMVVPLAKGLTGWTFNASDTRTPVAGLVNPFWVAVNSYFRALGIHNASAATQLATIVRDSIYKGDGTGCAEIADLVVPVIFGSGTEIQFQFQGSIADYKPFRDWLTEILACALGYYSFEFGKLRLGIRENAGATAAFGYGNMLYQSLSIQPIEAEFEYLRMDFANVALQYQSDMAEYQDKDHAAHFGRAGAPLTSRQRSVGSSSLSQSLRLVATRVREEIGGILRPDLANPYIEWDNNNRVTFKSTILALDTYVGQVIEVTHPDLPTYPGPVGGTPLADNTWKFRIEKWTLHKDWSVTIVARSVTDSMYNLDYGPKPADIAPSAVPILYYPQPLGQWAPHKVQAASNDALWPNEWTFDLRQTYHGARNGVPISEVLVTGCLPVNQFVPGSGAPDVKKGRITQSSTGGSLPGGTTYYVQVTALDASGRSSPASEVLIIQIPSGTNTNSFTLNNILWPRVDGLTNYTVFASDQPDLVCQQGAAGALTGSVATGYSPLDITITGPFERSTYGVPNPALAAVRARYKRLIHGGPVGAQVTGITTSSITANDAIDSAGTDDWTGRVLSIIGRQSGTAPFANFNITGFTTSTGVFTLDRDPIAAGVQVNDIFVVCFLGNDNSANPYVFSDLGLKNATNPIPHAGETVNDPNRIGNSVLVIRGKSRGQQAKIVSNTATSYTLDQPITIDAGSVWVVATAAWNLPSDVTLSNADPTKSTDIVMLVSNFANLPILVGVSLADQSAVESPVANMPVRMLHIVGAQGTRRTYASTIWLTTDRTLICDTSQLTSTTTTLSSPINASTLTIPVVSGASVVNGTYIQVGSERMLVTDGAGTSTLTVEARGGWGTTAASHSPGDTVNIPAILTVTLLAIGVMPDQECIVTKESNDLNVVQVQAATGDTLPNGATSLLLPDNTADRGTLFLHAPGA